MWKIPSLFRGSSFFDCISCKAVNPKETFDGQIAEPRIPRSSKKLELLTKSIVRYSYCFSQFLSLQRQVQATFYNFVLRNQTVSQVLYENFQVTIFCTLHKIFSFTMNGTHVSF